MGKVLKILQYSLGQLQANCYFLIQDKECLIIDPADDASFILEELQRKRLKLSGMLATHGHFDHVMAAGEIQLNLNVPLYIFKEDQFLIDRLPETAEHFLGYKPTIIQPKSIKNLMNDEFKISDFKFKIIWTPGHTPGSCCYYIKEIGSIITGDTLFKQGIGNYSHTYSSKNDLLKSLQTLFQLPGETLVYPGHGETTILKDELVSV